jgi:hypothetical protein
MGIAMTCLAYLPFDAFKVGYTSNDKQMEVRLREHSLLEYASQNWRVHTAAEADPILQTQILRFLMLNPKLSCSVQAMRLPSYGFEGYSRRSARETPGLRLAAVLGLTEVVKVMTTRGSS